jgi:putative SOS response-associated peptidase YedK
MCGRFTRMYTWRDLVELYRLSMAAPSNLEPRYNICPTELIPGWWKRPLKEMRLATFNARSESIAEKPMFRDSFQKRRCLIPASGYYEWLPTPDGKQPFYFTRRDGQVITFAGVQDGWTDPGSKERIRSCSIVITGANKLASEIHDRMPVILEATDFEQWERGDVKDAAALMKPADDDLLQKWRGAGLASENSEQCANPRGPGGKRDAPLLRAWTCHQKGHR